MKLFKPITLAVAILAATTTAVADVTLIGRRGCAGGVENSVEAYREAVARGFKMIEGHVRITADSVFVTSHDGKTNRLGGNLSVEKSPLAALKAESYTQAREDSVTYSGSTIATVAEFLEICKEGGATAVLHLKNLPKADDTSNLAPLVNLIDSISSRDSVLILSSSPLYINYLHDNYPDLPLMLQVDKKWEELFPLAKELNLPIDISAEFATAEMFALYTAAGLPIAVWTVNDPDQAASLDSLGASYLITDTLLPIASAQ